MNFGIAEVYYGNSGKLGYYNSQQIGLSRAMKKLGYNCFIFLPDISAQKASETQIEENITVVRCPAKTVGVHAFFDWSILKAHDIDVVQVGSDNHLFAGNLINYCDRNGILAYSYFGTVRSDNSNLLKRAVMNLLFLKNVKAFKKHKNFAKTEAVEKELENLGVADTAVVPVGLDTSVIPVIEKTKKEVRDDLQIPRDEEILLYVGRMDPYKRPQLMLSLLKELKNCYGVMIGDGELSDELEHTIKEAGLENRLKWFRRLPNEQVQSFYAAADYLVNFNDHEIFGMSILEAMYQGLTVIAFHAPGPDTIIEDGVSGYLVSDLNEMTDIVRSSKSLPKAVIQSRIKMSFTWDTAATCFDEWIRKATDIEKSNHNN